jgi:hypothetical protein
LVAIVVSSVRLKKAIVGEAYVGPHGFGQDQLELFVMFYKSNDKDSSKEEKYD